MSKATRDHVWSALPVAATEAGHPLDLTGFDPAASLAIASGANVKAVP